MNIINGLSTHRKEIEKDLYDYADSLADDCFFRNEMFGTNDR